MYLKKIQLAGFKSFVDPTTIPIRSRMNAIVGPNGCGKSNMVDAVRWVIGEISAKQLRGESMSDVIFNGTSARKPVGKAFVELLFDNGDGRVGGEYAKFSEISVRREVTREGQSLYFINGVHVRRRDILDLFLGTGLGPRSYAVIEQGMVSHLVEAKPDELRVYLEEAAGISKYKERRRETENRMRATEENLDRINDIREELIRQLNHLKRQANAAERYKAYKQKERLLGAQIKAMHWKLLNGKLADFDADINKKNLHLEKNQSAVSHQEKELERTREQLADFTEKYNANQKQFYVLGTHIARLEQQIQDKQEQMKRSQEEYPETEALLNELQTNIQQHREQITALESDIEHMQPSLVEKQSIAQEAEKNLVNAEEEMQRWQEAWDKFQNDVGEVAREVVVTQTKIEHYQQQITEFVQRQSELPKEDVQLHVNLLRSEIDPLNAELKNLSQQSSQIELQLSQYTQDLSDQRQKNTELNHKLQEQRQEYQNQETHLASLEALQQSALGLNQQEVQQWLSHQRLDALPRLGQQLRVQNNWELAVETVMSGYFDAVCVDAVEDYFHCLGDLKSGQLTLMEKSSPPLKVNSSRATLMDQVECDLALHYWLSGIYLAENLKQAHELRSSLDDHESVITKDGIWLGKNWIRMSKENDPQSGFLLREQQIQHLKSQVSCHKIEIKAHEEKLKQGEDRLQKLELEREDLHRLYQQLSSEVTQVKTKLIEKQTRLSELLERENRLVQSHSEIGQQLQHTQKLLDETRTHYESGLTLQQQQLSQREMLQADRDHHRDRVQRLRADTLRVLKEAEEVSSHLERLRDRLILSKTSLQRDQHQLEHLEERRHYLLAYLSENRSPIENLDQELQSKLQERIVTEKQLNESLQEVNRVQQMIADIDLSRQNLQKMLMEIKGTLDESRIQQQEIKVRQSTIQEQLSESDFDLQTVLSELPSEAAIPAWEEELANVIHRAQRLGDINLAAIGEFQSTSERKTYLDRQYQDLNEALEILRNAIRKIDKETRAKFQETFDRVNQQFQQIFPRIFNGGSAYLEMTEEDLLAAGIIVRAQPPGKRNVTIHMLSGGEKALTAIALVFALFQLNPAPFCMLDEVDAPLDDVNVGRFSQLVKEMSHEIQMLVISHNKVTIEAADYLMGVTMQEPGVSRIVSVDVKEAIKMVETT